MEEEGHAVPRQVRPVRRGVHHPVRRGRQPLVAQSLEHVADVARDAPGRRVNCQPRPVLALDLQPALVRAQQQGDEVDVLVRRRPHVARVGQGGGAVLAVPRQGRVVDHPQDGVTRIHLVTEVPPLLAQVHREGFQHPSAQRVQRREDLLGHSAEVALLDVHVGGHLVLVPVPWGQIPAEVPELLQVVLGGALGGLHAKAGVTPGASQARQVVLSLLLLTEREELLAAVERPRDEVLGHAVVLEDHEAVFLIRGTERLCETGRGRSGEEGDDESGAHLTKKLGTPSKKGVLVRYRREAGTNAP